jgi:Uma2 family endonuclease
MALLLHLPVRPDQTEFNAARWDEILADPLLAKIEGRVETDRFGYIRMSPPPSQFHGSFQFEIGRLLKEHLPHGKVITECPISTDDGVRATDVAWLSAERAKATAAQACLRIAPEICVEVRSPSNTDAELDEKASLYFAAGAKEVWWCEQTGQMRFFLGLGREEGASNLCPSFPRQIQG